MITPDTNLKSRILSAIRREERRRIVRNMAGSLAVLAASASLAVWGAFAVEAEAYRSGFVAFTSLLFTDFSAVAANFSDIAFSIAESFPILPVVTLLSGIFFAVWSSAQFREEIKLLQLS